MFLFKMLSRIGVLQGVTNSNSSRTTQSSSSRDSFNGGGIRAIGLESSQGNVLVMGRVRVRFGSSSSRVGVFLFKTHFSADCTRKSESKDI